MSNALRTIDAQALAQLNRALVGFDRLMNDRFFTGNTNYPPYNIVKYSDNNYGIEVAVAGFSKEEISIEVDQDQLRIVGTKSNAEGKEYLHRGLAARDFEQTFTLMEYMEVKGAEVKDGMLKITIERIIPESLKPRQIEIK